MANAGYFNTNRFVLKVPAAEASAVLASLAADEIKIQCRDIVETADDGSTTTSSEFHISGTGKLTYPTEGVAEGLLKMTGNMPAFYAAIAPMLADGSAFIYTQVEVGEDGWMGVSGASVTPDGTVSNRNLVSELISGVGEFYGNPQWSTDTHAIEDVTSTQA